MTDQNTSHKRAQRAASRAIEVLDHLPKESACMYQIGEADIEDVRAGIHLLIAELRTLTAERLPLQKKIDRQAEDIERLRTQWLAQRKALMQIAGQVPCDDEPASVARDALWIGRRVGPQPETRGPGHGVIPVNAADNAGRSESG